MNPEWDGERMSNENIRKRDDIFESKAFSSKTKGMLAICIFIGLSVFVPTATLGADWKFLQRNANGDFFYDAKNVTYSSEQLVEFG